MTNKINIMVVDDDKIIRQLLKRYVEKISEVLTIVCNGEDAVKEFEKLSNIDLILLDVIMPGIDGIEVLRQIRKIERDKKLKPTTIFMFTSWDKTSAVIKSFKEHCDLYLTKDCSQEKLILAIEQFFPNIVVQS